MATSERTSISQRGLSNALHQSKIKLELKLAKLSSCIKFKSLFFFSFQILEFVHQCVLSEIGVPGYECCRQSTISTLCKVSEHLDRDCTFQRRITYCNVFYGLYSICRNGLTLTMWPSVTY